jgi:hypothetical protein
MTRSLTAVSVYVCLLAASPPSVAQPADADRIAALEADLRTAQARVAELESTLDSLAAAVVELKAQPTAPERQAPSEDGEFAERIIITDLGSDDREEQLRGKPELFVQTAYFANRIDNATVDDADLNFGINRMELGWAGSVSERFGMGFELQYHPAPDGASEELINDAYVDFYASDWLTLRAGQFVKPFGFEIQQSSSERESPERGIFAGYFFPGQRDRGFLLRADLGELGWLGGTTVDAAILNGNRFFADNNDSLNYNLRLRHLFPSGRLAVGASFQAGTQILPPGVTGDDENAYGADLQYVVGRFGIRAEYVRGNTPSTLLGLEPEFAPAFVPGDESWGATAFFNWNLSSRDDVYWRWDRFDNDPVTGQNPRAFNVGYMRRVGNSSRVAVDYQWKDDVTFNDDELNTALSLRWDIVY